jgi:hypothetical protein
MCHSPEHVLIVAGALASLTLLSPTTLPYERGVVIKSISICDAASPSLPPTIAVEAGLESIVRTMLRHSPTFRQQCRILESAPSVTAAVRVVVRDPDATERALSRMRRDGTGRIHAEIEILKAASLHELLGHELEHVIEQLDGVDLRQLESSGEARRVENGVFETRRAIAAGQRVSGEVLDHAPDRVRRTVRRLWRAVTGRR